MTMERNMNYEQVEHWPECVKGPLKKEVCKGLDALDLRPNAHQVTLLCRYLEELAQWNRVYNLTAIQDMDEMLVQHLFDCLAIMPALKREFKGQALRVLDVGTGGGLPAVIIALLEPAWHVLAVDSVNKKTAFVQQMAVKLEAPNLRVVHARVESLVEQATRYDLIVSRAFSSLQNFTELTQSLLVDKGCWCAMKGKLPQEEIQAVKNKVDVFHVEQLQVPQMSAQRCLVWMRPCSEYNKINESQ